MYDKLIETLKTTNNPESLTLLNSLVLVIIGIVIMTLNILSLKKSATGFKQARIDIEASVKALIPPNSTWKLENGLTESIVKKYKITEAEHIVANLALLGKSNKEIANTLHKSVGTIEAQLKSVYQKTEAPGRFALIALASKSLIMD